MISITRYLACYRWWISLSPHHPAQVRCCEVNSAARDGLTGARRVTSRESGLLVPRTRTCTCVDVRAHTRRVVCGLGPGRDVAGGRPARDARASGRARAHRGRGRAPRRTRNPAPASAAARALAPARALALVLSVLVDHRASVGLRVFCKHGSLGAFPRPWTPSPSFRWRWLKRGRPPRMRDGQTSFSSRQHHPRIALTAVPMHDYTTGDQSPQVGII